MPSAICLEQAGPELLAWVPGAEALVRAAAAGDGAPTEFAGRAPLGRLADARGAALIRSYRKGGLMRGLRGARFHGRLRPLDELVLHVALAAQDLPVVEALGCTIHGDRSGWTGRLLVREIAGARDLEAWLYGADVAGCDDPATVQASAGRAVRALHDAGVRHADLHPKNLLLVPSGGVRVIDLDRAQRGAAPLADGARLDNLARYRRAIEKHRGRGMPTGRLHERAFFAGYAGSEGAGAVLAARVQERLGSLKWRRMWWRAAGSWGTPKSGGRA